MYAYTPQLLAVLALGQRVLAGKNMAQLYSGSLNACQNEPWDESLADKERDMDAPISIGRGCIGDQLPEGGKVRHSIWIPNIQTGEGSKNYCLVMSADGTKGCHSVNYSAAMAGQTMDIVLNDTSAGCQRLPAGDWHSFKFYADYTCERFNDWVRMLGG